MSRCVKKILFHGHNDVYMYVGTLCENILCILKVIFNTFGPPQIRTYCVINAQQTCTKFTLMAIIHINTHAKKQTQMSISWKVVMTFERSWP